MTTTTYLCDQRRNTACASALCFERGGPCGTTDDVRYALRDFLGVPVEIVDEDFEKEGKQHGRMARH